MTRMLGLLCLSMSMMVLAGCDVDSTPQPPASQDDVALPGAPSTETPAASAYDDSDALVGRVAKTLVGPDACSVTLNYCDGAGATGTDCTETGCSLSQAISTCKSIVSSVGCAVRCNAVMRNSNGTVIDTWRQQCGSTCCPEGQFCSGTRCCDGSCKPGCPC